MYVIPAQDALRLGYSVQVDCGRGVTFQRLFASLADTLGCPWMLGGPFGGWGPSQGATPVSGATGVPSCFSEEVAASCPACSSVGAPVAPTGGLFAQMRLERHTALPGVALLFAFPFQAFYLGLLPCL